MKRKEKLIGLFMVLFTMISLNAFAGHGTHNGSVSVTANGSGTVYISNSNDGTDIEGVTTENGTKKYSWNCGGQSSGDSKTFVLRAVPAAGYVFTGWTGSPSISGANANVTVNANSNSNNRSYTATFAEGHTYYTRVKATAVGTGLVYVGTKNNPSDEEYKSEIVADNEVFQASAPSARYYWVAKEIDGSNYKFVGWYDNPECTGNAVSTSATMNINNLSGVEGDGEYTARYAKFVPYETYYSSVTVVAQEGGTVYVSNGQGEPNLNDYTTKTLGQNSTTKNVTSHSYTLYAQANPGYDFRGWRLNNSTNNASTNNQYTVSFNANSTNEAEPTSRTYTAVFVKKGIWNWEKPTLAAGNYYIYNPAADKFLGNANNGVDAEDATLWTLTDNSGTWKISEGENHVYVDRTGGSVPITQFYQIDPSRFTAYSSGSKTTSDICSDVFWIKGDREYTFNTYLTYYEGLTNNDNDRKGDIYIGLNGANLSTSTENNAQKWYFVTEAEMEAYKEYVAAYNRAVEIVTEIPEWGETKNTLNGIINANVPSQLSTSDANIAALNSIIKVTLSVKAGKYSTIITPFEIELPEGITAYTSSSVNPSALSVNIDELVSGNEMLPADRPVILKNTTGSDIAKTYYGTSTKEEPVTEGVLIGYYTKGKIVPNGYYSLQTKSGVQQFYPIRQDDYHSAANKCYLIVPDGEELANVRIALDSEETSIDTIANLMNDSEYYSVNGVKLSAPKKGVNIVKMSDGSIKKVFVK